MPGVHFVGVGALNGQATIVTTIATTHASTLIGDILLAQILNKAGTANAFTPPAGWTAVIAAAVTSTVVATGRHQYGLFWNRAATSGATGHIWTKATDDNVAFQAIISSWRGAVSNGSPLDATVASAASTTAVNVNVAFPAYDPTAGDAHVIYASYYGDDATTMSTAMAANANPVCTIKYDVESTLGTDCSMAITSGDNDGAAVLARTWASSATVSAGSTGVVFAILPESAAPRKEGGPIDRSYAFILAQ